MWPFKKKENNNIDAAFPFSEPSNMAVIACPHIFKKEAPILNVHHDEDDGAWQFLCNQEHAGNDAQMVSLGSVYQLDNSIGELCDMPVGYVARRNSPQDKWEISKK